MTLYKAVDKLCEGCRQKAGKKLSTFDTQLLSS
jgi:hypothetical protein